MSAPLVVNTRDGMCWTRRTVTSSGIALYAPEGVCGCPEFVMATLAELAEHGVVGSANALPMPVGTEPKPRTILDRARDALDARMTKDDLRLVLGNVIAYAARLEAESVTANEALDDAAEALRSRPAAVYAERARQGGPAERTAYRMLAADVADGEHYLAVHHDYRVGHDLPETGGAR